MTRNGSLILDASAQATERREQVFDVPPECIDREPPRINRV